MWRWTQKLSHFYRCYHQFKKILFSQIQFHIKNIYNYQCQQPLFIWLIQINNFLINSPNKQFSNKQSFYLIYIMKIILMYELCSFCIKCTVFSFTWMFLLQKNIAAMLICRMLKYMEYHSNTQVLWLLDFLVELIDERWADLITIRGWLAAPFHLLAVAANCQ